MQSHQSQGEFKGSMLPQPRHKKGPQDGAMWMSGGQCCHFANESDQFLLYSLFTTCTCIGGLSEYDLSILNVSEQKDDEIQLR